MEKKREGGRGRRKKEEEGDIMNGKINKESNKAIIKKMKV